MLLCAYVFKRRQCRCPRVKKARAEQPSRQHYYEAPSRLCHSAAAGRAMAADKSKKQSKQGSMSGSPEKCSTRFLGKLQHEWVRNPWPDRVLVSKDYSNSYSVKCKKGLKIRYSQKLDEDGNYNPTPRVFKWAFEVTVKSKYNSLLFIHVYVYVLYMQPIEGGGTCLVG